MPRLLTYNVHRCVGVDRKLDVARIVGVIAEHEPDIVCLQELDVGRARTGYVDQAVWAEAVEALARGMKNRDPAAGFEAAISLCGGVLAEHFPPRASNPNEIEDRLVLI